MSNKDSSVAGSRQQAHGLILFRVAMFQTSICRVILSLLFLLSFAAGVRADETEQYVLDRDASHIEYQIQTSFGLVRGSTSHIESFVFYNRRTGEVQTPVIIRMKADTFLSGNAIRDRVIHRMFESERYPFMEWTADRIDCEPGALSDKVVCEAQGRLRIRDLSRKISYQVVLSFDGSDILAKGFLRLKTSDFGLRIWPELKVVRSSDDILVLFETRWLKSYGQ